MAAWEAERFRVRKKDRPAVTLWIDSQESEVKTILVAINRRGCPDLAEQLLGGALLWRRGAAPSAHPPKFQLRCSSPRTKLLLTEASKLPVG